MSVCMQYQAPTKAREAERTHFQLLNMISQVPPGRAKYSQFKPSVLNHGVYNYSYIAFDP